MDFEAQDSFSSDLPVCYEIKLYLNSLMQGLAAGEVLEFISPDPGAEKELLEWAALRGYDIISTEQLDSQQTRFLIRR
jgi:TusA-related sulfurtransferase